MLQVQDIYRRDFSSHFRAYFIKNRSLCDKIKLAHKSKSEQQLKYLLLEWGRDFKRMYIDAEDSHLFDICKEAENFIIAKMVSKKLTNE